ncbi:hypothetical protein MY1884_009740, partial [Beauveria asiatica]
MSSRIPDFAPLKRAATRDSLEPWLKSVTILFGSSMLVFFLPILLLVPLRVPVPSWPWSTEATASTSS